VKVKILPLNSLGQIKFSLTRKKNLSADLFLQAIFTHELQDVREKEAWNVWRPLEIVITLTPQQGSSGLQEVHAHIDLHVTCSEQYPEQ
jgi:hypothetical protein